MKKQIVEGRLVTLPLNTLHISPLNARPDDTSDVSELAALINSQGQLQNLIVVPEDGEHGAVAGGRRYRAFKLNESRGLIPADHPVFCLITTPDQALAASVAENSGREPMHPAEEFYAFKVLFEEGMPVEDIAAQFGVTPLVVRRRLLLAKVAPELVKIYRDGGMDLEQLQAFTLTDDQKQQCKVWYGTASYFRHARGLREALTKGKTEATSVRVGKFVGLDAYEAAGGQVLRDLFGGPDSGYVTDMALMQKLAGERLEAEASELRAEGWAFVKIYPELGWSEANAYSRSKPKTRELTAEEKTEIASLEEIANAANEAMQADSEAEMTDGMIAELEHKAERAVDLIAKIKGSLETFSDRQKKSAGAIIGINLNGNLEIHRGMIDPKVEAAKEKAKLQAEKQKRVDAGEAVEPDAPAHSEALTRKLTAHRSAAMSAHLLDAPRVALDLLCSTLLAKVLHTGYYGSSGLAIVPTAQLNSLASTADDMEGSKAWEALTARREQLLAELPEKPTDLFAWVGERSVVDVVDLLAFCTAACINVTSSHAEQRLLEPVEIAIGLDMADWWQPSAQSYLGQVPKPVIISALEDAGIGEIAIKQADKLKKGDLARKAEELLVDSGWLPALFRSKTSPAKKVAKAKVASVKKAHANIPAAKAPPVKTPPVGKTIKTPPVKKVPAVKTPAAAKSTPRPPAAKKTAPVRSTPAKGKRAVPLHPPAAWPFPSGSRP